MTPAFDSHAHLQDPAFASDLDSVVRRIEEANLAGVLVCGYDPPSNHAGLELTGRSPLLFAAVGYHPHESDEITLALLEELASLAALPQVVAVGEIGLDFYRDLSPREIQRTLLDAQLEIAIRVGKPVSVHSRAAEEDILEHLAAYSRASGWSPGRPAIGVMHCFGGTLEQAVRCTSLGFLVSLACTLTYPGSHGARTIAKDLPLESLVVETDSPYLPPQGLRGKRNEPANVRRAVDALASARGISAHAAASATTANAVRLLGVTLPSEVAAW